MYHYFYDSYLNEKKYRQDMTKTETRLMDLGINGKVSRLSFLKDLDQTIKEEVRQGAKTFVIVGNDNTFGQMINNLANLDIVIGFIPIGEENNSIAKLLGISYAEGACDVLSARIIDSIDLGQINNNFFLTSVELNGEGAGLNCDNNFYLSLEGKNNSIRIYNLSAKNELPHSTNKGNFVVEIKNVEKKFLFGEKANYSYLTSKHIFVTEEHKPIAIKLLDENKIIKTPAELIMHPQKLKIIVGKNRLY